MNIVAVIFALVIIGTGITFLPAIKEITDSILGTLTITESLLVVIVGFWPLIVFLFFVYGAYTLVRKGGK